LILLYKIINGLTPKYIKRRTGLCWGRQTIPRDETFAIWDSITEG
jgi:hypothetical protein